jgi:hypothetical protein
VSVPTTLKGKKKKEILDWARSVLNGQEADLRQEEITAIREGTLRQVTLKPKRAGFYHPVTGEFIEALGSIKLGEDLEEADKNIEVREQDNAWVDEENLRFRRPETGSTSLRAMWEHGKRIEDYLAEKNRPAYTLHTLLAERGGKTGFALHTHQTASQFYKWMPNADPTADVFSSSWELIDAVLKFSKDDKHRNTVFELLHKKLAPRGIGESILAVFLRGPKGKRGDLWKRTNADQLSVYRQKLRSGSSLSGAEIEEVARLLLKQHD